MKRILFTLALCLSVSLANAKESPFHDFKSFTTENGLPEMTFFDVNVDKKGLVWFATLNGVSMYTQDSFVNFSNKDGINSSYARSIVVDDTNQVWVAGNQGLMLFDRSKNLFNTVASDVINELVWSVFDADKDSIYVATETKIFTVDKHTHEVTSSEFGASLKMARSFFRDSNGDLWIGTYSSGVYLVKNKTNSPVKIGAENLGSSGIFKIIERKTSGDLYFATTDGVFQYHKETGEISKSHQFSGSIRSIEIDYMDTMWVASGAGVSALSTDNQITHYGFNKDLDKKGPLIYSIKQDDSGNIWFASDQNGIYQLSRKERSNVYHNIFNNSNISQGADKFMMNGDKVIVQAQDMGLISYDTLNFKTNSVLDVSAVDFHLTDNGDVYYTKNDGVSIIRGNIVEKVNTGNYSGFGAIYVSNGEIYTHTSKGVIKISSDEKITLIQDTSEDQDSYAFDIRIMNSDVYVNYGDRLDIIKSNGDIQSYSESSGVNFSNNSINDFYLLDGKLYIATWGGGVVVVSGDKSTAISYFDGMDVLTLTPIKSGILASMADGIFLIKNDGSIETSGYLKVGSDKKQVFKSSYFSDGKIYLLYSNGLYEQKLFSINENDAINTPLFTGLKIKNKDVTKQVDAYGGESIFTTKKIDLHYYDSPVSIEFNAIGDGRDISYQYKMSDVDGDWVSSESNNIATYTNIPSGEHSFLVKSLYNGKELARSSVMVFVTPPLWLSTQAFVFYGLAFIGIAWLPISNIINKEKHRAELEKSENRLKTALWGSSDLLWDLDVKTNMLYFSSEHHEFNFPNDTIRYSELTGSTIHHADIDMVRSELGKHLRSETDEYNISYRISGDSDYLWVHDKGKVVSRDANGAALRFSGTIRDISIEKAKENEFLLMAKSMENINDAIWIASDDFKIVQVNNAFSKIMGFSDDALIGSVIPHPLDNPFIIETIRTSLQNSSIWKGNLEVPKADGTFISISLSVTKMKSDNDLNLYYVGAFSDISFEVRTKKAMETLESIDSLTGLTNRSFFKISHQEKISKAIEHSVIFIEIDNFKRVNDTLGFDVGDKILVNIAKMIKNTINKNDRCLVSRMGGDEFVVTIEGDNLAGRSSQLSEAIREKIIESAGKEFGVTVAPSIGISLFPADAVTSDDLLKSADIAVYHAKSLGGNQVQFFKSNLNTESKKEIETEKLIRDSIRNEWFEVFYQPKINIRDKSISGMEALVRIRHPERGLVFPDEFIPLSEKLNLIGAIDDIVMKKACTQTKKWVDDGLFNGKLSLNMSAIQFKCPDIVESTMSKFNQYGLPSSYLEIEITETLAMDSIERTCDILSQFKSNGICISMDDFGTGYSSLSYLKDLPIDKLKIDRSFINNMSDDIKSKKLVSIIINMAHSFNLTVVAEGIETMDQLLTMELMNCDEAQGYFFSRPITSQMMEEMLIEKNMA